MQKLSHALYHQICFQISNSFSFPVIITGLQAIVYGSFHVRRYRIPDHHYFISADTGISRKVIFEKTHAFEKNSADGLEAPILSEIYIL